MMDVSSSAMEDQQTTMQSYNGYHNSSDKENIPPTSGSYDPNQFAPYSGYGLGNNGPGYGDNQAAVATVPVNSALTPNHGHAQHAQPAYHPTQNSQMMYGHPQGHSTGTPSHLMQYNAAAQQQGMDRYPSNPFAPPSSFQHTGHTQMQAPRLDIPLPRTDQWAPVQSVITIDQLEQIYVTIRQLEDKAKAQQALLQQRIEADIVRDEAIAELTKLVADLRAKELKDKRKTPTALMRMVHTAMIDLLYTEKIQNAAGEEVEDKRILPHPLPQGAEPRLAEDKTRLWNPDWTQGIVECSVNKEYRTAVVALVRSRAKNDNECEVSSELLKNTKAMNAAVKQYFKTLRARYNAQTTPEGQAKQEKAQHRSRLRNRKHERADLLRMAQPLLLKAYGAEATEGFISLIHTDWMTSERSDCGERDPEDHRKYRESHVGDNVGFEMRPLMWRAERLVRLYRLLLKLLRDSEAEKARLSGKRQKVATRKARFPAHPENYIERAPTLIHETKAMPYKWCVSEAWAARNQRTDLKLEQDPADFKIFQFTISDGMLDPQDIEYLKKFQN